MQEEWRIQIICLERYGHFIKLKIGQNQAGRLWVHETNPWRNFCDPCWEFICYNKWDPGTSGSLLGLVARPSSWNWRNEELLTSDKWGCSHENCASWQRGGQVTEKNTFNPSKNNWHQFTRWCKIILPIEIVLAGQ